MNERLKELDKQAVDYALSVCDANGVYQGKEYLSVVKERFAELIVQECSSYVENTGNWLVAMEMKEHFGV